MAAGKGVQSRPAYQIEGYPRTRRIDQVRGLHRIGQVASGGN